LNNSPYSRAPLKLPGCFIYLRSSTISLLYFKYCKNNTMLQTLALWFVWKTNKDRTAWRQWSSLRQLG